MNSSFNNAYKNNVTSMNPSTGGTINEVSEPKEIHKLFVDTLDAFPGIEGSYEIKEILSRLINDIHDLNDRLTSLEKCTTEMRNPPTKRLDWREIITLAEFRISEHGGKISQKELRLSLEIKSRTTMSSLAKLLKGTGRYTIRREGRNNMIEAVR